MNKFLGGYQVLYGVLGCGLNTYNLLTSGSHGGQTVQVYLILLVLLGFSAWVLLAGVAQCRQWTGWLFLVLPGQLLQVVDLHLGDLFLRLRCGLSVNLWYEAPLIKWNLDPNDIASALAWRMPAPATQGLNLVALLVCVLVLLALFDNKAKAPDSIEA